jgi:Carboxypeptidase regulatory-like domain
VILRVQAFRIITILAIWSTAAAVIPSTAAAAGASGAPLSSVSIPPVTASRPGTVTGTVVDSHGQALAGVCVTASRAVAGASPDGRAAVTSADGTFMITGLRAGLYRLRYRTCVTEPGKAGSARAAALGPGPLLAPAVASRGYVADGRVTMLGRVTLSAGAASPVSVLPPRPSVRSVTVAQLRRRSGQRHLGGIAGRVLGPHGRPVKGLCFNVDFPGGSFGAAIAADGRYSTGKVLPPGSYTVDFTSACASPDGVASANWATEWFRGHLRQSEANPVTVKAGKITRGIGGVMRPGGVIAGTVTGKAGRGLAKVCVVLVSAKGAFVQQVATPRSGRYRFQGIDPGRYGVGFFPNCGLATSRYLPQWWPGTKELTKRGLIKTGIGTVRTRVDARLVQSGAITGTVRFRNRHGAPLKGICVDVTPTGHPEAEDFFAATKANGTYSIGGLPAGRYAVSFSPGCDNNGNYLSQNYPHSVTVRLAHVTTGINAYLRPGGIISGTVTAKFNGARLRGICVATDDGFSIAETGPDGAYSINQISPGETQVQFWNCANPGNFAPQVYPNQLDPAKAVSIKVGPGQVVKGIDAALAPGATISGAVTLTSGGQPSRVCVDADPVRFFGNLGGSEATTRHGGYAIKNLPPGTYQVQYRSCGGPNIGNAWFRAPGQVTEDQSRADQLRLALGQAVTGVDAVVQLGASISGWIYGPSKLQGSLVCPVFSDARTGLIVNDLFAAAVGEGFTIFGFAPGRYLVEFFPCEGQNLAVQWYDRVTRPGKATPVVVRSGHTVRKVNAWLTAGGSITGRVVSKLSGKPLGGICVVATGVGRPAEEEFGGTNAAGKYVITGLTGGTYRLLFSSCGPVGVIPVRRQRVVRVTAAKTVAGPNVALVTVREGAISGRISAAGSPAVPVANACVDFLSATGGSVEEFSNGTVATGTRGRYEIGGLIPGKYKIFAGDPNCDTDPGGLVPQWYLGTSQESKATVVTVTAGRTTGSINITMQRDGSISGIVTGPKPAGKALAGICLQITSVKPGATPYLAETTSPSGDYHTGPLPPGKYLVEFESGCGASGFAPQWWHGAKTMKSATPVVVQAGRNTAGVSAIMTQTAG